MRVQLRVYDKAVIQRARSDDTARQLMSAPGVGTVVARRVGSRLPKLTNRTIKKRETKHIEKQDHAQRPSGNSDRNEVP
jgi:hypothetical protein